MRAAQVIVGDANKFRVNQGLAALSTDTRLMRAAQEFAEYMARTDRLSHEADGREPAERAKRQGYDYCMVAENIGYQYRSDGFRSAAQLSAGFVKGWANSPEHRKNLLDREALETGVGVARNARTGRHYAVQLFGVPASKSVRFSVTNEAGRGVEYLVGSQRYTLPRRTVRTHDVCGAESVAFEGDTLVPTAGARFFVVHEGERLSLRRR